MTYIKIPKELQKKRGRKKNEPAADPQPKAEAIEQAQPASEPIEQAQPAADPQPGPEAINIAEELAKPEEIQPVKKEIPEELENLLKEYNTAAPEEKAPETEQHPHTPEPEIVSAIVQPPKISLVRGYMLLLVLDFVMPTAITIAMRKFGGQRWSNLKSVDLRLTDSEFNDLEPIADEVAKDIQLNISPMTQLLMGMAVIYSSKLMFNEKN